MNYRIDNLQYCKWSREIFEINNKAGLNAVHVTLVYHEDYDELQQRIQEWNKHFEENEDLIFLGNNYNDITKAKEENKTAIFFGFQNCSPIEDDIYLVEKVHEHGCRFLIQQRKVHLMQLKLVKNLLRSLMQIQLFGLKLKEINLQNY